MASLLRYPSLSLSSGLFFFFFFFFSCLVISMIGHVQSVGTPLAAVAPISLHPTNKSLYTVSLRLGSPPTTKLVKLALDLSNSNLWTSSCPKIKSSLLHVSCDSPICAISHTCNAFICGGTALCQTCDPSFTYPSSCTNDTCVVDISNPFMKSMTMAQLWQDSLLLDRTEGFHNIVDRPPLVAASFPIGCDQNLIVNYPTPAEGVEGFTGLSRAQLAMPTQLSRRLGFSPTFAYCLPSTTNGPGPLFFGDPSSYTFLPGVSLHSYLTSIPILTIESQPDEYFITVNQINVGGSRLSINGDLLKVKKGKGGTRLSTAIRYTQLESSILKSLSRAFITKATQMGIPVAPAVPPFKTCFDSTKAKVTHLGYGVPQIDLLLNNNKKTVWQMTGLNSVVPVSSTVFCLAFEEKAGNDSPSIILGTFQQQERLMRFDLASNALSFSPNLNGLQTSCSNFNFTLSS